MEKMRTEKYDALAGGEGKRTGRGRLPEYGNWVPAAFMKLLWGGCAVLLAASAAGAAVFKSPEAAAVPGVLFVPAAAMGIYMGLCRREFSYRGGGLMGKIHSYLLTKLEWDGNGGLLDIGCGSGALTILCAKRFPKAELTGVDFWGREWSYAKEQCEENARTEGAEKRIRFQKGDAAKLDFPDESFDAAVSNFVFHEVKSQPDKRLVVKEALRVVKKGGAFAFHDLFEQRKLYGDMEEFVEELRREGISELHYEAHTERLPFIPAFVKAPWMLTGMGILYGIK